MAKIKIDPKRLEGANERAEERIAHTRALRTERADEADKLLTPSETRLHRAALEMERADERDKLLVPSASRAARADERDKSNMPSFTRQVMSTMPAAPSAPTNAARPGESLSDFAARQKLYEIALADERDKRNTASMTDAAKSIKPLQRESTLEPFHLARDITSAAAKLYAGSQLGAAGNAVYGSSLRNAEQASGDIAAWQDTINAYRDVLNDRESTESERATAKAVIGDLTRRINAYQTAYGTGGVTQQAARRMEDFADRITESGARDVERAQQGMDRVGRWLVGSSVSGLQMGADAAIGALTGLPAIVPMLTRSFGGGVQEARQKGYNHEQQMALGLANAATEYFSEKLFGGNPVYDDDFGLVNMLVGKLTGNTRLLRALDSLPADMISEGLEEVASDLLNPLSELAASGNWTGYDIDGIIDSFVTGFLTSGVANVGAGITNTVLSSERTASDEELREELVRRIMTNQDAVDSLQRGGLATITDDMSKAEQKAEIARAVERLNGQENSAATGTRPAQTDNLTREANRGAEARILAPARSAADFEDMTARNVTAEQAAADVMAATRNADLLGRNGARMFHRYYDEDMARYLSPADATEAYGAVYQAALAGREAPQVNAPKVLAEAARIAGENDRRDAAQAQYFGEDAGFVADTNRRGTNLTAKDVRTLDALFKTLGVRGTMADTLVSRDEDGNLVGNNAMIENGRMTLARDAEDPVRVASVHESVHRIRQAAPEAYSEMARFVIDHMSDERLASTLREHNARYAGLSESEITEEMVADAYGVILGESDMLDSLVTQHRSAAQRLFDAIRDIIDRIKKALRKDSGAQLSDEQREAFRDLQGREEEMARLLGKALERTRKRAAEAEKNTAAEGGEVRYSRKRTQQDADYLAAVERGDTDEAQRMVDEAAKEAGYVLAAHHGTGEYFNVFNRGAQGIHLGNINQAKQVADTRFRQRSEESKYKWSEIKGRVGEMSTDARRSLTNVAYYLGDYIPYEETRDNTPFVGDLSDTEAVKEYVERWVNAYMQEFDGQEPTLRMATFDRPVGSHVMRLYAKINNPLVINGDVLEWTPSQIAQVIFARNLGQDEISFWFEPKPIDISGSTIQLSDNQDAALTRITKGEVTGNAAWDTLADVLDESGFDGIQYLNRYEGDKNSPSYIALRPSDVKSADPITYDEKGNVIPLSERFNERNEDIRYSRKRDSKGRELSEAQAEYFKDSKVRDANGQLLTLYHGGFATGGNGDGNVFAGRGSGYAYNQNSIFLTDDVNVAQAFGGMQGRLYELYADIKNPIVLDAQGRSYVDIPIPEDAPDSLKDFFLVTETADADNLPVYAQEYGYDGVIIRNVREGVGGEPMTEVIALSPEQVKNVDNRNPTSNPDIRFSRKIGEDRVFRTPLGVEVVQNPTDSEYAQMRDEVYKAYPFIRGTGEPPLRRTFDEDGNEYYWSAMDAMHYQVEPYINREFNTRTNQSWKWWEQPDKDDYPTQYSRKRGDMARREAQLLRENDILRDQIGLLKSEMKRSDTAGRVDPKAVRRAARELIDEYSATVKADEITGELQRLFDAMGTGQDTGGEVSYESLRELADGVARTIAESALDDTGSLYSEYDELRSFLRNTPVTVTARETENISDWGEWRKEHMGRLNIKRGDTTNIDRVYDELSNRWPEFFPGDVITVDDQIQRMADVADMIYADRGHNPYDPYMDQAVIGIGNDIMERFFDLPEYKTFADKQAAKLAREQIRTSEARQAVKDAKEAGKQAAKDAFLAGQMFQGAAMAGQIRTANARIDKLRAQMSDMRQRNKEAMQRSLDRVRQNRDERLAKQQERFRARTEAGRQKQRAAVLRKRIERHASELSQRLRNSTDKKNVPDTLRGPVAALLESINMESKDRADGSVTKRTTAFRELKKQYQEINKDSQNMVIDPDLLGSDAEGFQGLFDRVLDMGETKLYDMSEEQLQTVWKVLRAVEHSVTTYGRNMAMQKYATTAELANNFLRDVKDRRDKSSLGGLQGVVLDLENAYTFFDQYGETGKSIYRMLRNAQDEQRRKFDEVIRLTRNAVDEKTADKLRKERRQFTTERGEELTLTTAHIMELYLLSRREQALNHLIKGGIVQPEIQRDGKQRKINRGTEMIPLTQNDLGKLAEMLTPEQMQIANALQAITSDTLAAWGNEAALKAYGYKKFTEKNYWPIKSAAETLHSNVEKDAGNVRSIKNIGMAKNVIPNASNAVSINDVFDTFAGHTADMLDYATWLLPMEDVNRFFNFKFKDADGFTKRTVKQELDRVGGPNGKASRYWQNLMNDIQNGIDHGRGSDTERVVNRIVGNTKGAAVGGNARVVIQQPTAFFRAAAVMEPESLTKGLVSGVTAGDGWEKAQNWSGIARIKDAGGFDQGSRRSIGTELWNDQTPIDRLNDAMSWAARKADAITWGRLWNAAEWEAKRLNPNLPEGSTEFYRKAAEIFTDTVDQSQVVDGVLQRPQIMRSGDRLTGQMTAFMGEPLMSVNMFLRAWDNVRYENNPASRSKAIKRLGRTAAALAVTDAVNALAQSVVDAWRDDDKDKKYWERFLTALTGITGDEESFKDYLKSVYFGSNFVGNINPLNRLPILKDTQSIMQGFSVERLDASTISDIIQAHNRLWSGKVTLGYGLYRLLGTLAKLRGIPVTNLERDVLGVVRSAVYATGDPVAMWNLERAIYTPSENTGRYYDILELALRNGDTESYETLRERIAQETDKTSKDVDDAVKSRLNKNGGMNRTAAELLGVVEKYNQTAEVKETFSNANLNPSEYTRYSNQKAAMFKEYRGYIENSSEFSGLSPAQKDTAVGWAKSLAEDRALSDNSDGRFQIETDWEQTAIQAQAAGIGIGNYLRFHLVEETSHDDKDANGKTIKGRAKKDKIREWLESQRDLTDGQREWLWSTQYSGEW